MKKLVLTISMLCYLAVSCGIVINYHYCMNDLASTSFFSTRVDTCGTCGMEMHEDNDCCHDEVEFVKMSDDQNKVILASFDIPSLDPIIFTPSTFIAAPVFNSDHEVQHNHSPPIPSGQDIYLQINVLRI